MHYDRIMSVKRSLEDEMCYDSMHMMISSFPPDCSVSFLVARAIPNEASLLRPRRILKDEVWNLLFVFAHSHLFMTRRWDAPRAPAYIHTSRSANYHRFCIQ